MGDRWERRNPLVDQVVDVDAAVVPAPPPPPPVGADGTDPDLADETSPDGGPVASGDDGGPTVDDSLDEDDEEVEETDSRFARRNPLIEKALGGD